MGETDGATIINGIGQGSFAAALASSINIGTAVDEIRIDKITARIGDMELNSLIHQDDIAKMNFTLEDVRNGAKEVGRMLESEQSLQIRPSRNSSYWQHQNHEQNC